MGEVVAQTIYEPGASILGGGTRGLRFRTQLEVATARLDQGLGLMRRAPDRVALKSA